MRVTSLKISNFRSFTETQSIPLGSISVFIGPNNAGKSSILRALHALQESGRTLGPDVRLGSDSSALYLTLADIKGIRPWNTYSDVQDAQLHIEINANGALELMLLGDHGEEAEPHPRLPQLPAKQPDNFIVPYLSQRKTTSYAEDVRTEHGMAVGRDLSQLTAKLARLVNPEYPAAQRYIETCRQILGFVVTPVVSENGQRPGLVLENGEPLYLEQMGDGVPNIVGLLADLALAKGKMFLIEEPENDLHPTALKALLELVEDGSSQNQIVVSTHSNIVARHLGAATDSLLYYVESAPGPLPRAARVNRVDSTPEARLEVLRELGYSFSDFDLWDGWIILEESSAERIIRDYLIPWFAPKLTRVRTVSARGNSEVEPTFADFYRLIRFTHLEDAYRGRAWVLIDGDETGQQIIKRLRTGYPTWEADRFECFGETQFEHYYPNAFAEQIDVILEKAHREDERQAKRELLDEVRAWLDEDENRGRAALAESAAPVVVHLQRIEAQLLA